MCQVNAMKISNIYLIQIEAHYALTEEVCTIKWALGNTFDPGQGRALGCIISFPFSLLAAMVANNSPNQNLRNSPSMEIYET